MSKYWWGVHSLKALCNYTQKDKLGRNRWCYEDSGHKDEHRDKAGRIIHPVKS